MSWEDTACSRHVLSTGPDPICWLTALSLSKGGHALVSQPGQFYPSLRTSTNAISLWSLSGAYATQKPLSVFAVHRTFVTVFICCYRFHVGKSSHPLHLCIPIQLSPGFCTFKIPACLCVCLLSCPFHLFPSCEHSYSEANMPWALKWPTAEGDCTRALSLVLAVPSPPPPQGCLED